MDYRKKQPHSDVEIVCNDGVKLYYSKFMLSHYKKCTNEVVNDQFIIDYNNISDTININCNSILAIIILKSLFYDMSSITEFMSLDIPGIIDLAIFAYRNQIHRILKCCSRRLYFELSNLIKDNKHVEHVTVIINIAIELKLTEVLSLITLKKVNYNNISCELFEIPEFNNASVIIRWLKNNEECHNYYEILLKAVTLVSKDSDKVNNSELRSLVAMINKVSDPLKTKLFNILSENS